VLLPLPLNLSTPRTWLQPTGAGPGEIACGLVIERQVRWLRANVLRSGTVEFSEIMPATNPKTWRPAPPVAVSQAERALRDQVGRMVGSENPLPAREGQRLSSALLARLMLRSSAPGDLRSSETVREGAGGEFYASPPPAPKSSSQPAVWWRGRGGSR
jgi:hypothetical protein